MAVWEIHIMTRSIGLTNPKGGIRKLNYYFQGEWETSKAPEP